MMLSLWMTRLIMVSDSTTIIMAGKRSFSNLQTDLEGLKAGSNISSHWDHLRYVPIRGASMRPIVDKVHELVADIVAVAAMPQRLHIDVDGQRTGGNTWSVPRSESSAMEGIDRERFGPGHLARKSRWCVRPNSASSRPLILSLSHKLQALNPKP